MPELLALDVAILPPPDVRDMAIRLSRALPAAESQGLELDEAHRPHVTLTQMFVRKGELDAAFERIDNALRGQHPLSLDVVGGGRSGGTVWMTIERSTELLRLHERLMEGLRGLERPGGTPAAFCGDDARFKDAVWVGSYRLKSSFGAFTSHITLGHASEPPAIEPFRFTADLVAACHLGRFCTCREVLRAWTLI